MTESKNTRVIPCAAKNEGKAEKQAVLHLFSPDRAGENKEQLIKMESDAECKIKANEKLIQQPQMFFQIHKKNKAGVAGSDEPKPFDKLKLSQIRKSSIKVDQVARMRIPSDEIIVKDEDSLGLSQSITCPICLMILQVPYYECQGCSNGFCMVCLQSWWKKAPNTCAFKCSNVQFKIIKRSNTYNAVMGMLKTKCQYCRCQFTLADISTHIIKSCPEVSQFCRFCNTKLPRKAIEAHEMQECEQRPWKCPHCEIDYRIKEKDAHDQTCKQKLLTCLNKDCLKQIKRKNFGEHGMDCDFKEMVCNWCEGKMIQKEHRNHIESCEQKKIKCVWCGQVFGVKESNDHEIACPLKREGCRLCHQMVLVSSIKEHKIECMFENMIDIKNKNQTLEVQNIRLKQKIMLLEGILEETIASNKSNAMKAVSEMREQDKRIIEKDLLRLDNSIRSVEKLKREEIAAHMKFPHIIQSWCPICKQLQRKFKAMLEPLLEQRKQVLVRIAEIQRFSSTPQ